MVDAIAMTLYRERNFIFFIACWDGKFLVHFHETKIVPSKSKRKCVIYIIWILIVPTYCPPQKWCHFEQSGWKIYCLSLEICSVKWTTWNDRVVMLMADVQVDIWITDNGYICSQLYQCSYHIEAKTESLTFSRGHFNSLYEEPLHFD